MSPLIPLEDIEAAAERIRDKVRRTPFLRARHLSAPLREGKTLLKLENLQVSGSFKARGASNAAACLAALESASGFLQREIGKKIKARVTPRLSFIYDDTDIRGRQMSDLIDSAIAADKEKQEP